MFSVNEQFYLHPSLSPSLYHCINYFLFARLFLTGYLAGSFCSTFLYMWLKSYLVGFGFICCCFLTNVNCVVSTGVRINPSNFLFCFYFPLGSQCSAVVLLKLLCAHREVCIIPGDDAWEGKTVESFRSAEFEKLWNILLFQMCTIFLKYVIERLIMKPQEGMFSHLVE